jgi:hypothetical protein
LSSAEETNRKQLKKENNKTSKETAITMVLLINLATMKLGSGIFKDSIKKSKDEDFYFYNSLALTDDLNFIVHSLRKCHRTSHAFINTIQHQMIMKTYPCKTDQMIKTTNYSK